MKKGDKMRKLRISFGMENEDLLSAGHYGDSAFFLIYDFYENGILEFIEKRENITGESLHGDFEKFKNIINILYDVDVFAAYRMGPNFLNIRDKSNKIPYLTRTRNLKESIDLVKNNFEFLWEEKLKKLKA